MWRPILMGMSLPIPFSLMAKSPELEEVRIKLNFNVSVDEELKMLREMLLFSFPRGFPNGKLIIDRP
ncbi:hypothetical protein Hanom_Chr16g01510121 [Helianthus anomalus]